MYGLVVECIVESIKGKYGEDVWLKVQEDAKIEKDFYDIHEQYSESVIKIILSSLSKITSKSKIIWTASSKIIFIKNIISIK